MLLQRESMNAHTSTSYSRQLIFGKCCSKRRLVRSLSEHTRRLWNSNVALSFDMGVPIWDSLKDLMERSMDSSASGLGA